LTNFTESVPSFGRSTLAAETLALADGIDAADWVLKLSHEFGMVKKGSSALALTDSRSLFEAALTTNQVSDRRLRVEISAIRETKEKGEIEISWISKDKQLADVLTKKGASPKILIDALSSGIIDISQ